MKTDKEYPATHSMSTSWYIVDDDGNVGILNYNENGPVPWGVEQTFGEALKYGHWEDYKSRRIQRFNLTNEQILDLLHEPHSPEEEVLWFDCVVKIDKSRTSRFLSLCKNQDISNDKVFCVSEELGLYELDAFDCVDKEHKNETIIHGTLKTMLEENLIIEVYTVQSLDVNDENEDGEFGIFKEFDNSPYFMFYQPYMTNELTEKVHVPEHPVTIDQVPETFRHRLHRIPGKFKDMDTFQIAQYYPCGAYSNADPTYMIDGCLYQTSPLPDGRKVYTKTGMFRHSFLPYCSEKTRFHCETQCTTLCCSIEDMLITDKPTVLLIFDPKQGFDYSWKVVSDIVFNKSYITSYIPKFPYRTRSPYYRSRWDVDKLMTDDYLLKVFNGSKGYIESIIADMNPRVILVTDNAYPVISEVYSIDSNKVKINEVEYPIYKLSSLEDNRADIEALARLEYQGKEHPHIITLEEMDRLVQTGLAKEYKYI